MKFIDSGIVGGAYVFTDNNRICLLCRYPFFHHERGFMCPTNGLYATYKVGIISFKVFEEKYLKWYQKDMTHKNHDLVFRGKQKV